MKTCLVLIWVEDSGIRKTGELERRDANWFEATEACAIGCACIYSRDLNERQRGHDYAANMLRDDEHKRHAQIVELPDTDDVLSRARAMALHLNPPIERQT